MAPVLSVEQVEHYLKEGYAVVSGLIPEETTVRGREVMLQEIKGPNARPVGDKYNTIDVHSRHPDLLACHSPAVLMAAAQLSGEDPSAFTCRMYDTVFGINLLPVEGPWWFEGPHIDSMHMPLPTFRCAHRIVCMIYLNEIESQGGGTVVWPKSHRKIQALARSNPSRFMFLNALGEEIPKMDLGEPVELTTKAGGVAFLSGFCAHTKSANVRKHIRLAMSVKW